MELLDDPKAFAVATREVFGPFQVVVEYGHGSDDDIDAVLGTYVAVLCVGERVVDTRSILLLTSAACANVTFTRVG